MAPPREEHAESDDFRASAEPLILDEAHYIPIPRPNDQRHVLAESCWCNPEVTLLAGRNGALTETKIVHRGV